MPLLEIADELSRGLCACGRVAVLHPAAQDGQGASASRAISRMDAVARFGPLIERCELEHDHVLMVCGASERIGRMG